MKRLFLFAIPALAACQPTPPPQTAAAPDHASLAFAQGACGGCHAVEPFALSPNPDAPPFEDIANRSGMTPQTLTIWLRDAHNYPEQMDFTLDDGHIDGLVAHIMGLQRETYRPVQ